jgi:hypothetical protein
MLALRDLRRVTWRRSGATEHYLGYLAVSDETIRLSGREEATHIDVALSIPHTAIRRVRLGAGPAERIGDERAVVVELADRVPIFLRPVERGEPALETLARRLATAVEPQRPVGYPVSSPCASA